MTIFKPTGTGYDQQVAGPVEILRELGDDERDPEVGRMFEVRNLENGLTTDAFADELSQ